MVYSHKLFGQERAVSFLKSSLKKKQIASSYLFSGREGLGKKLLARQFTQSLICEEENIFTPCNCVSCEKIASDIHPDVKWIGSDEGERFIKIEDIRRLQSWAMLRPLEARRKVFIINRAERLTEEAANAFLKTLEEPPPDTHIILLTDNSFRLSDTILSRLLEVRLSPLSFDRLCEILHSEFLYLNTKIKR